MGEAALPVMGSIEAGLSCSVALMLGASRLAIVSAIDDCSAGEIGGCRARLQEAPEWSLESIVYLNRLPPHLLSNKQPFLSSWILSDG